MSHNKRRHYIYRRKDRYIVSNSLESFWRYIHTIERQDPFRQTSDLFLLFRFISIAINGQYFRPKLFILCLFSVFFVFVCQKCIVFLPFLLFFLWIALKWKLLFVLLTKVRGLEFFSNRPLIMCCQELFLVKW